MITNEQNAQFLKEAIYDSLLSKEFLEAVAVRGPEQFNDSLRGVYDVISATPSAFARVIGTALAALGAKTDDVRVAAVDFRICVFYRDYPFANLEYYVDKGADQPSEKPPASFCFRSSLQLFGEAINALESLRQATPTEDTKGIGENTSN